MKFYLILSYVIVSSVTSITVKDIGKVNIAVLRAVSVKIYSSFYYQPVLRFKSPIL